MQEDDKAEAMKSRKGWPEARSYRRYLNQELEGQKGKGKKHTSELKNQLKNKTNKKAVTHGSILRTICERCEGWESLKTN